VLPSECVTSRTALLGYTLIWSLCRWVRLRLWIAATNGPNINPPCDIWAWTTMVELYRQGNIPDSFTRFLWQSYQQSTSSKAQETWQRKCWIWPTKYLCSYFEVIFTFCKFLRHGANGFTSPSKEGCGFLSPFKIYRLGRVWKPRTVCQMASTLTITPPRH
jgi:hypothetical protein